jgi:AcrR family transcriptional regulator
MAGHETAVAPDGTTPRRTGRPRQADVDERVVQAVLTTLARDGYDRLRVEDVAATAGVAKTTVYRRWPSKESLIAQAVSRLYLDRVRPVDTGDLRTDLVALLADTYELLFTGPGRVLEDLVRRSGGHREIADIVKATNAARRRAFHQALSRGVARGDLDPGIDHDLAVDLLVGPLWTRLLITGGVMAPAETAAVVDAVLHGLVTRSTT